jgi:hypothetical protein
LIQFRRGCFADFRKADVQDDGVNSIYRRQQSGL